MKKLFTNDKFFLAVVVIAVLGLLFYCVNNLIYWPEFIASTLICFLMALCEIGLYVSYKKHSKNVMKGLMGALLMAVVANTFTLYLPLKGGFDFGNIFKVVYILLTMLLLLNHFIINSDRHPKPGFIKLNQVLCVLIVVVGVVWIITRAFVYGDVLSLLGQITSAMSVIGLFTSVVCIESRLDAYKLDREAAGWTEEAGYPEGYVHEYQKRK